MIRLAVRVRRAEAERVLADLLDLAPGGVEERDDGDVVEYAIYGPPGEVPELPDVRAAAGAALVEVSTSEVRDDWAERWREFHRPLRLPGLVVRPPWEPAGEPGAAGGIDVVIDPGRAFGTGAHATTRLCLELLLDLRPDGPLADLGCGSGVLAVAAAKLGWAPVLAVDHDPASVEATAANAAANGVEVEVARLDLLREEPPSAPTVVANLTGPLLLGVSERLGSAVPERVVVSGMLAGEADGVAAAFARHGLVESERRPGGEWAAALLVRR